MKASNFQKTKSARVVQVIETVSLAGDGTDAHPIYEIHQYWRLDGKLLAKSELLADFKAVKDGNVWCTGKNLFQETTGLGTMIEDIHTILTSKDDSLDELNYMHKLK